MHSIKFFYPDFRYIELLHLFVNNICIFAVTDNIKANQEIYNYGITSLQL